MNEGNQNDKNRQWILIWLALSWVFFNYFSWLNFLWVTKISQLSVWPQIVKKNFFFTIYIKNIFTPFIASATVFIPIYRYTTHATAVPKNIKFDLQKNTHHISLSFIVFCPYCMKFMINSFTPYIFPFYIHFYLVYKAHVFAGRTCSEAKNRVKINNYEKYRSPLSLHININWFNIGLSFYMKCYGLMHYGVLIYCINTWKN